jgi:type I restriction enzyme M protein
LLAVFEDCHNHIYANEGLLKEKIFHEIVKLLLMKLSDEEGSPNERAVFGITNQEHQELRAGRASSFEERIAGLFRTVKHQHPRLFADDSGLALRAMTLAFVIGRLQFLNLTRTPGDVKGKAFQAFVNRHQRGDRGEFFTPHPIVRLGVEMIDPKANETIVDPCCGSGGFLIQAIAHVCRQADRNAVEFNKPAFVTQFVRGIEFNPDIAQAAMLRLAFEGGSGEEITCRNALTDLGELTGTFDIVLTNPPFGSKGKILDSAILASYELARKWNKNGSGTWKKSDWLQPAQTPDILFLEQCLRLLRPGGRMAVVLPDGLIQNVSSGYVRAWLKEKAQIAAVISIPQEAFVPYGTGIKTSLVVLRKLPVAAQPACFMARIKKMGYDVKGQPVLQRDKTGRALVSHDGEPLVDEDIGKIAEDYLQFEHGDLNGNSDDVFSVAQDRLNSRLDVEFYLPSDLRLIAKLCQAKAKRLGDLADICTEGDDFRLIGDDEIRYIAISDIDARTMQVVSQQIMTAHEAPTRATYRLRVGDIVTATSGASTGTTRQATALITEEEDGAICSNGLAVLRNIRGIDPMFLLSYLRTNAFLRQVRRLMTGHAIPAISLDDLANILIPIPPAKKQLEIAESVKRIQALRQEALKSGESLIAQTESLVNSTDTKDIRCNSK